MKKYLLIILVGILLISCNTSDDVLMEDEVLPQNDIIGDELRVDQGYMGCIFDKETQSSKEFDCANLGEIAISNTTTATAAIMPVDNDLKKVYIAFTSYGKDLNIPKHEFETAVDANMDWSGWRVYFLNEENIYIWDRSGGEGSDGSGIAFYNGESWYDWDFHSAIEANLPAEYQTEVYALVEMKISESENEIDLGVRMGEGYGNTVNYILTFDRSTFEFKELEEKQKY